MRPAKIKSPEKINIAGVKPLVGPKVRADTQVRPYGEITVYRGLVMKTKGAPWGAP